MFWALGGLRVPSGRRRDPGKKSRVSGRNRTRCVDQEARGSGVHTGGLGSCLLAPKPHLFSLDHEGQMLRARVCLGKRLQ
jgi:hypothetical protein